MTKRSKESTASALSAIAIILWVITACISNTAQLASTQEPITQTPNATSSPTRAAATAARTPSPITETSTPQSAETVTATPPRVDVEQANRDSAHPTLSADGRYVAFSSAASNLVDGDTNEAQDIFVYDRHAQGADNMERVSVAGGGTEANDSSRDPVISSDGRYVAFTSSASNLVPADRPECGGIPSSCEDIFVYDRQTDSIERIVPPPAENADTYASTSPTISEDARYVAFQFGLAEQAPRIFVYDRQRTTFDPISAPANDSSVAPDISADGRFIVFQSFATNLTSEGKRGIFIHDYQEKTTEWLHNGILPAISADGQWVTFFDGDALVVYDRRQETALQISDVAGAQHGKPDPPAISRNGRWIAYATIAPETETPEGYFDVFVYDRQNDESQLISVANDGTAADGGSSDPAISGDGRYIAFVSGATTLVPGDTNDVNDVFVYDRQTEQIERVSVVRD